MQSMDKRNCKHTCCVARRKTVTRCSIYVHVLTYVASVSDIRRTGTGHVCEEGAEKIFGPKSVEIIQSCIKLHIEEAHNL
jgi:pyruvate/2-oxoacid:ferredoxin oxidoreductase beta subunit